jgi:iron-sulfur cluster insertion protein
MSAIAQNKSESPVEASDDASQELVKLTARAAEKVKAIRAEEKIEESYGLRLKVMGGGCSGFAYDLFFDQPQEVDQAFESQGIRLLCDQMSLMYLVGTEIDYVESLQGSGFKFTNPNVKSTCGCGSSFSA